jgi:hypothetical protein
MVKLPCRTESMVQNDMVVAGLYKIGVLGLNCN